MTTKHHTRDGYEQLLINVCLHSGKVPPMFKNILAMQNITLIRAINGELIDQNCIPFTYDEVEAILDALEN